MSKRAVAGGTEPADKPWHEHPAPLSLLTPLGLFCTLHQAGEVALLALGLDIGTGFARAAVFRQREAELLQFPDGSHNIPALVSFVKGGPKVGRAALSRAATQPHLTVRGVKRLLGRKLDDPVVQRLASRAAYDLLRRDEGDFALQLGDATVAVEDVAAALIRHVVDIVEQKYEQRPSSAVLTTPYWYGWRQRNALEKAACAAGLESLQVLTEATCTALSLLDVAPSQRLVAVIDVGAGGCTASIVSIGPARVQLVASAGDPLGGGDDLDWALAQAVVKGLEARLGEIPRDPCVLEMVRQVCEGAKPTLAQASSVTAIIPFLPVGGGVQNQEVLIGREHIEALMRDSVARVAGACRAALASAQVTKDDLAAVVATGGTTRLPAVRAAIAAELGGISSRRLDPDGSVALGAANQAAMLAALTDGVAVIDVQTSMSVPPPAPGSGSTVPPAQIRTAPPGATSSSSDRVSVDMSSVRVEMASLLSSLRAGAVTDGGRSAPQASARANDITDEEASLTDDQVDANASRIAELWTLMTVVMQTSRQYRWDHPQTEHQLERCMEAIRTFLQEAPNSLAFDVGAMHLSYHRQVVWKMDRPPYDRIPYELFVEGVRKLQLKPGLSGAELKEFLGVLLRDVALGFGAEDDAATALWDRKLKHVGWLAVDAFADADDPEFLEQRDDIVRQLDLRGEAAEQLGAYAAARRALAGSAAVLALDDASRIAIETNLQPDDAETYDRFALAFRAAWTAAAEGSDRLRLTGSMERWALEQVAARGGALVLHVFRALDDAAALCASHELTVSLREALVAAMLSPQQACALLDSIADEQDGSVLEALGRALELLHPDVSVVAGVIERYPGMAPSLRDVVIHWLAARVSGFEQAVADALPVFSVDHARVVLAALRSLGTPESMVAVSSALRSPHAAVRMEALASLPEAPMDRIREDIRRLVEDPDTEMRMRVLQTVASRRILAAGPALMRRIQTDSFHELDVAERRMLLEAVGALNRSRAETLALELLEKRVLLHSASIDATRVAAAEFLASATTPEVLDALRRVSKARWFTSDSVRVAAQQAAGRVEHRRSEVPPKPREGA